MLSANELHRVTDRPHQVRVGAFGCFDTNNTLHSPVRPDECVASFSGPRPAFRNPGNEEAGEREHVLGVSICPGLHRIQVVDLIKMVDNTNVKLKRAGNAEE